MSNTSWGFELNTRKMYILESRVGAAEHEIIIITIVKFSEVVMILCLWVWYVECQENELGPIG